jgi:hypothetical protein
MKYLIRFLGLCLVAASLVGCSGVDNSTSTPEVLDEQPASPPAADAPPPMQAP